MKKKRRGRKHLTLLAAGAAWAPVAPALASLLGDQLYPSNYPWNQIITNAPVAANSAGIIAHIGNSVHVHADWGDDNSANGGSPLYGIPYNVVHGNTATKISVSIDNYPGESDIQAVPIPTNAVIEGDYQNGPNPHGGGYLSKQRGDSHLIVWDEDNNIGYELYGTTRPADTNLFPNPSGVEKPHTDGLWHAAQETVWNFNTGNFRTLGYTSADAAGLSILAGLVRPDEGSTVAQGGQGVINHAFRFTLPSGDVNPQYTYPGSHMVSTSQGANNLPLGARLRLKNTATVNTLINSLGPQSQIVARAMQQYGLILADIGSAMYVTGTSAAENATNGISLTWNTSDVISGLGQLAASNFDVVNLQPMVTGLSPANGSPGSAVTITGRNFSGAAGQLSVFFGGTNAGPVSVVGDSQISAIVPGGGVGTVDVTVQSGADEVDSNSDNPNANVNAPIFGYGISAVTVADKFVYLPAAPTILRAGISSGNFIMNGTNNSGSGGTYHVLTSGNLLLPESNWMVVTNASFDSSGRFFFTNTIGTNRLLFYSLRVP